MVRFHHTPNTVLQVLPHSVELEQTDSVLSPGCGGGAAGGLGGGLGECGGGQRDQRLQSRHAGCEGGAARQGGQTLRRSLAPGGVTLTRKGSPGFGKGNRLYRRPGSGRCRAWWQQWPEPGTLWPCPSLSPLPPSTSSLGRRGRRRRCGCLQVSGTNRCGTTLTKLLIVSSEPAGDDRARQGLVLPLPLPRAPGSLAARFTAARHAGKGGPHRLVPAGQHRHRVAVGGGRHDGVIVKINIMIS